LLNCYELINHSTKLQKVR